MGLDFLFKSIQLCLKSVLCFFIVLDFWNSSRSCSFSSSTLHIISHILARRFRFLSLFTSKTLICFSDTRSVWSFYTESLRKFSSGSISPFKDLMSPLSEKDDCESSCDFSSILVIYACVILLFSLNKWSSNALPTFPINPSFL